MTLKLGTEVPGTSAEGNITTLWVPTIADIKRPTMAELEAGTDISNYVMLGGWTFEPSQDTVSDQRENSTQDFGAPGRKSAGDISIEVIDNTNTEHAEQNKAVTLMAEGNSGFIVRRRGMATDAALAAGQKLTVVSVKCGEKKVLNPDANTMIRSTIHCSRKRQAGSPKPPRSQGPRPHTPDHHSSVRAFRIPFPARNPLITKGTRNRDKERTMALEVKRKRVEVDLILDQEKAERISQLGEQLARAAASHVTEGANAAAKRIAKQIDELREEVSGQIVHLTLEALPLSQWRQVLEANTTTTRTGAPRSASRTSPPTRSG